VKIDQSFVQSINDRANETLPLIRAIVDLAHGLGLTVLAEGLETERQLEVLSTAGCDLVQGHLIHRPEPAGQAEAAFRQLCPTWSGSDSRCEKPSNSDEVAVPGIP
jgi:EAL domain-containing protein (putative c-di-GMP-specific phosphodiesterase class I)